MTTRVAIRVIHNLLVKDLTVGPWDSQSLGAGAPRVNRPGSVKFELGALGLAAGRSTGTGAGFSLALAYDSPTFTIPAELRFAHSSSGDRETSVFVEDRHWGPGLYAEAGVQIFRLHRGRMTARVRADFPLYSLHPEGTGLTMSF